MGRIGKGYKMLSVYLPIKLVDAVKGYCGRDGRSFNGLVRELLIGWLEGRDAVEAESERARKALRGGGSGW